MMNLRSYIFLMSLLFLHFGATAQTTLAVRDTLCYPDGTIREISDWDKKIMKRCGLFMLYDSLGRKTEEGTFQIVDSIKCKDCFEWEPDGSLFGFDYSYMQELKVGVWKSFHPDGQLKETGSYSDYVHEYRKTIRPYPGEDGDHFIYNSVDYLKTGRWEYYDEQGRNYKTVQYYQGQVVRISERE